ncbi:MAG: translation initiation factor [Bacteroidia bacterium]|nr:translation initiation factor [Bacteroidia bacterium]MBT8287065.1 translation initiation factor [Bacteroidia bacterium]
MDLKDQLKSLFPDHVSENTEEASARPSDFWMQDEPLECHFEKRKGKPITIIKKYNGAKSDFKRLTRKIQKEIHVGGSFKDEMIFIQGDYRDEIMKLLKSIGFNVKRVGG